LRYSCCAVSREKTSVFQLTNNTRNLKRKKEKVLGFISFEILNLLSSANFSSAIQVRIKFETKAVTLVVSVLRSKVRNAGIEIYHFTSSEKFQGH
jgi:hypothetical protein